MLPMLRDLVGHKWHAHAAFFKAIRQNEKAAQDEELRKLLLHILLANRFWLMLSLGQQFDFENERHIGDSLDLLTTHYRETSNASSRRLSSPEQLSQSLKGSCRFACTATDIAPNVPPGCGNSAARLPEPTSFSG